MRQILIAAALTLGLTAPAHAGWTCVAEMQSQYALGSGAFLTLDDQGQVTHEEIRWVPGLINARQTNTAIRPLMIYDVTGKADPSQGRLTNIRLFTRFSIAWGQPGGRAFLAIQVDEDEMNLREWPDFANRGDDPAWRPNSMLLISGVIDLYPATDQALFQRVGMTSAREFNVYMIRDGGERLARANYNIATTVGEDRVAVQALEVARNKAKTYRRFCQAA